MDYWQGQKVCWPPSQIIGRGGPGPPAPPPPPVPTPMFSAEDEWTQVIYTTIGPLVKCILHLARVIFYEPKFQSCNLDLRIFPPKPKIEILKIRIIIEKPMIMDAS